MTRKVFGVCWMILIGCSLIAYIVYADKLSGPAIGDWIKQHSSFILIIYSLVCALRGLLMLPATPFIFAGILLFPTQPFLLLILSLCCIMVSSLLIYYASRYLNVAGFIARKHPLESASITSKLSQSSGFWFITAWALLPFTPTDLIIYGAGTIKIPVWKVVLPVLLGEAVICAFYIFNGTALIKYIW
jgi:uncharacterized membrane protein YdjX (TVP38/TMEM64 family)